MDHFKRAAAFTASLLICLSAAAFPIMGSFAENENKDLVIIDDDGNVIKPYDDDMEDDQTEQVASGQFIYKKDGSGNAHIFRTAAENDELVIPEEIDGCKVVELMAESLATVKCSRIVLPASLEYVSSENPFARCENLKVIEVNEENENYCAVDGVLYTKDMKSLVCCPVGISASSLTIPEGVETVGVAAVYGTGLSEIKLPSTLKTLERHSFGYNEKLEEVDMSGTKIETIGTMAFVDCSKLKKVVCSDSTTEISLGAFMNCEELSDVTLSKSLVSIRQNAFQGTNVKKIRIPESVKNIGYCAFGYDKDEDPLPDFVIIGARGSAAQTYATDKDSDYSYTNTFTFMTNEAADMEEELAQFDIIDSGYYQYTVIDGSAMIISCITDSETVNVPASFNDVEVTKIYRYAFSGCGSKTIILPETIKEIGREAFGSTVERITIPGGCTSIEGTDQFVDCVSLKEINVTEGDGEYASIDGVLYSKDCSFLIAYPCAKEDESFKAPKTLDDINDNGFCFNQHLKYADLSTVKYIGSEAFEGCETLCFVKLSKDLKYVGDCAFLGCISLDGIHVYDNVEEIGNYAFGFKYDEELAQQMASSEEENVGYPYSVMEGFKLYTKDTSLAYKYAKACGIRTVTNTMLIGKKELTGTFVYVICGIGGAVVVGLLVAAADKLLFKKKRSQKKEESGK